MLQRTSKRVSNSCRPAVLAGFVGSLLSFQMLGQSSPDQMTFEVASVRVHQADRSGDIRGPIPRLQASPGTLTISNFNLKSIIVWAYHLSPYQASAPDWLDVERY